MNSLTTVDNLCVQVKQYKNNLKLTLNRKIPQILSLNKCLSDTSYQQQTKKERQDDCLPHKFGRF
jgi:hypothetical protein